MPVVLFRAVGTEPPKRQTVEAFGSCIGGIGDSDRKQGRTFLFVSIMPHFGLHYLWLPDESLGGWLRVRSGGVGDLMAFDAAIADRPLSRRRKGRLETVTIALAAVALSLGAVAWSTD